MKVDIDSGQKIVAWMRDKVRRFQCPVCQHLTWNTSEDIYTLTCDSGPPARKAVVTLQCANCASLTFFDAASIGIVSGSSGDRIMQDLIKLMNEMADALERGPDKSNFEAMNAEIQEKSEKLKALQLSGVDTKKLNEKYKDDMAKAGARLSSAAFKFESKELAGLRMPDLGGLLDQEAAKKLSGPNVK